MTGISEPVRELEPGEIVLHEGLCVVETDDPILMVELLAKTRFRHCVAAQLSDCAAAITPGAASGFTQELLKVGHTPKVLDP